MIFPFPESGLYAITETENMTQERLCQTTEAVMKGGATVLQFRDKTHDKRWRKSTGLRLLEICHQYRVPIVINDDVALAYEIGADGVHLGQGDKSLEEARNTLGPNAIVGISCYSSAERARSAENKGATYVAFGCFFASTTKPKAIRAKPEILHCRNFQIPVVAIGGITSANGKILIEAGADLLAVIGELFIHSDPERSARDFQKLFH